jgi:transposase-like protein
MPQKTRKRFTAQEKVAILRLHLLEHVPASDLCDQHGIHPTMFYRWQKEFFENGSAALEPRSRGPGDSKDRQIALLEQKLQRKHEVLSELMEEPIKLKKELGELGKERGSPRPLVMWSSSSSDAGPIARSLSIVLLVRWLGITPSKFSRWSRRPGTPNRHNAPLPRHFWLEDWEKAAIPEFHDRYPLEGSGRLASMRLDADLAGPLQRFVRHGISRCSGCVCCGTPPVQQLEQP